MATVIHDLPRKDQKNAIKEVARVLKPDGVMNIIEFKKIDNGPGPSIEIRLDEKEIETIVFRIRIYNDCCR
jgi:ubiquinone/menaquinone biosynthesis C-methylase UbiE